jgi:hypothetical protein
MNIANKIIAFESGELNEQETIDFIQSLVTSGTIYHLQGSYQRLAESLIEAGLIDVPNK